METNPSGEVTAAYILKGSSRERVYRHSNSLILFLPAEYVPKPIETVQRSPDKVVKERPKRKAAKKALEENRALIIDGLA